MNSLHAAHSQEMPTRMWLWQRLGWAGFLFFLIKGILWLTAPAVVYLLA